MNDSKTQKPVRHAERLEVFYSKTRWELLRNLRSSAIELMTILERANLRVIAHGSIARGDVRTSSDIDIFIEDAPSSFTIETTLESAGLKSEHRCVIQATPHYAIKGYIEVDDQQTVSFPLMRMKQVEREFYRFAGEVSLKMLKAEKRVLGVDKRLMLISPVRTGHVETSIISRESAAARVLHVSHNTVMDRVHALLRRDKIGRTGVFIKKKLNSEETFESAVKRLARTRPEVRRSLKAHD